jgi:hypothetical protein
MVWQDRVFSLIMCGLKEEVVQLTMFLQTQFVGQQKN